MAGPRELLSPGSLLNLVIKQTKTIWDDLGGVLFHERRRKGIPRQIALAPLPGAGCWSYNG